MNESPLRRERPYDHSRGNPASMALERLPPTCVAGRGDDVRRKDANARMHKGERSSRTTAQREQAGLVAYYSFYADTAARLAPETGTTRRINLGESKSMLAGATGIRSEVEAITVADGLTEAELVIEVADARQKLADAGAIVKAIMPPVWMSGQRTEELDDLAHNSDDKAR